MAISWGPIIAGAYTGTYNSVDVGFTLDGFRYGVDWKAEMINQSDLFGDTLIDMVYRGGDAQMTFTSRTFKAGALTPFWPWGQAVSAIGQIFSDALPIGRMARDVAAALVLTGKAATPAVDSTPSLDSLTASKAILAPNTRGELLFDSKARNVPMVLQLLPYESATSNTAIHCLTA